MRKVSLTVIALSIIALAAWLAVPGAAFAQDYGTAYEYEPGEGVHEEEWYDPSDWFDNDEAIDYENDWYDYTYNYPETYTYDYDYVYPGEDINPYSDLDYGWHYDYYSERWFDENDEFDVWYD